jgi:hypothetical protein
MFCFKQTLGLSESTYHIRGSNLSGTSLSHSMWCIVSAMKILGMRDKTGTQPETPNWFYMVKRTFHINIIHHQFNANNLQVVLA